MCFCLFVSVFIIIMSGLLSWNFFLVGAGVAKNQSNRVNTQFKKPTPL